MINAFTVQIDLFKDLKVSVQNYWSSQTTTLDGSRIPSYFKISGTLSAELA